MKLPSGRWVECTVPICFRNGNTVLTSSAKEIIQNYFHEDSKPTFLYLGSSQSDL